MKVRVKFEKTGPMKYIGHLDMMRFFQKAIRRAGIDVAYSEGFSPHMIMSFAYPLGVGMTSSGEYFDLEKTKRSMEETDIRPMIYRFEVENQRLFLQLASGSARNLKPDLVMEAFYRYMGEEIRPFAWKIHRQEIYADVGTEENRKLVTLESLGKIIE